MESESKIRRLHFVQGYTIKALVRKTRLSRNTIRRVLRSEKAGCTYERVEQPKPKLGKYADTLASWLLEDSKLSRKERRTAARYHAQLQSEGYKGAYDSVQRYVKSWKAEKNGAKAAYVPLVFEPGDAYQFDWSEETVEIAGSVYKVKVAHFRLCNSRKFFVVAYFRESQEMLFDAHNKAFSFFGGLCKRGIYDNMKTAVTSILIGKERLFNRRFLALMDHYLLEPVACSPAAGWEKGQVENQVDNVRDWIFRPRLKFESIALLNAHLMQQCELIAQRRKHPDIKHKNISDVFRDEQASFRELPYPFEAYQEVNVRVSSTCLINYDRNRYSVDCAYANNTVCVRAYANRIVVYAEDKKIGEHPRQFGRDHTTFDPWHYVPLLERKPGALRNGAPFKDWALPKPILNVKDQLLKRKGGDRECVAVLVAMLEHGIEAVQVACELALADKTVSKDVILNSLSRLHQESQPQAIEIPIALKLSIEPTTDCTHYNSLLKEVSHVQQ